MIQRWLLSPCCRSFKIRHTRYTELMSNLYQSYQHLRAFPRTFWVLILASFLNQVGNMAVIFLVLYLTRHLHFTVSHAALGLTIFSISLLITGLVSGSFIDRLGSARIIMLSLFANSITLAAFPFFTKASHIYLLCIIWGMTYGCFRPASQTLISELSPSSNHKLTFSVYRLAVNLGLSVGPVMGGYLAAHSFIAIFIANSFANLVAGTVLYLGLRGNSLPEKPSTAPARTMSIVWLWRDKNLGLFLLGMVPITMVFYQHEVTLPVFLDQFLHLPLSIYGWLFTINTLLIVCFEIPINIVMLNFPYRINFVAGSLCIAAGFFGLMWAHDQWGVYSLTVLWTLGEMMLYPSASSYVADIAPSAHRGSYMSILSTSSNLGLLLGAWFGALAMQHLGAPLLWVGCGGLGLLSVILLLRLPEPQKIA